MDYELKIPDYEQWIDSCPTFLMPLVLKLRNSHTTLTPDTAASLISRIALSLPNPARTRVLIDPEGTGRYDNFYPQQPAVNTPDTNNAIDTFLNTYGKIAPAEEELLNRMIFNPVPDYAATLERDNPQALEPHDEQDKLLDAFIAKDHQATQPCDNATAPQEPQRVKSAPAGSLLSESLAKIFIKQHNYKSAYEIISSLSLNYPEKSIYFADQMRFLSKLIKIQEAQEAAKKR